MAGNTTSGEWAVSAAARGTTVSRSAVSATVGEGAAISAAVDEGAAIRSPREDAVARRLPASDKRRLPSLSARGSAVLCPGGHSTRRGHRPEPSWSAGIVLLRKMILLRYPTTASGHHENPSRIPEGMLPEPSPQLNTQS